MLASKVDVWILNSSTTAVGGTYATFPFIAPLLGAPSMVYSFVPEREPLVAMEEGELLSNGRDQARVPVKKTPGLRSASIMGLPSFSGSSETRRWSTTWPSEALADSDRNSVVEG